MALFGLIGSDEQQQIRDEVIGAVKEELKSRIDTGEVASVAAGLAALNKDDLKAVQQLYEGTRASQNMATMSAPVGSQDLQAHADGANMADNAMNKLFQDGVDPQLIQEIQKAGIKMAEVDANSGHQFVPPNTPAAQMPASGHNL